MKKNTINSERRSFFKKAGIGAIGAALTTALPLSLLSKEKSVKNSEQQNSISIKINPMAVKRENRK